MTSKTSNKRGTFERCRALMGWTIKKYKYTLLIYSILLFLAFPMMGVFCITGKNPMTFEANDTGFFMFNILFSGAAVIFSVVISFINFSYMQKKTSVDWYFSFPMTRRAMLVSKYMASAVMSIVPMLLMAFAGLLIQISSINKERFFASLLMLTLAILSNISFVGLLSVCCGTTVDGIISYSVITIIYPIAWSLVYFLPTLVLPGYVSSDISLTLLTAIVPFVSSFMGVFPGDLTPFSTYQYTHLCWWLLFTVLCTAGSIFLIKRRRAESAQNAFAFNLPAIIIKIVAGFVGGVALGLLFSVLSYSGDMFYLWFLGGAVLGAFSVTFLLHIIYSRGTKGFSRSLLQFAFAIVSICLFYIPLITGWFGYAYRIPAAEEIESIGIYMGDNNMIYSIYTINNDTGTGYNKVDRYVKFENSDAVSDIIDIHQSIVDNLENIYDFPYNFDRSVRVTENLDYSRFYKLKLDYVLKNGRHVVREYEYAEISQEAQKLLEEFAVSQKYAENMVNTIMEQFEKVSYFEFVDYNNGRYLKYDDKTYIKGLLEAVNMDIDTVSAEPEEDFIGELNVIADDGSGKQTTVRINITKDFKNTLEYLGTLKGNAGYLDTETADTSAVY